MAQPTKEELLFGRIAVHNKLLSQEQYQQVLALRMKAADPEMDFGRICKDKGLIEDKQYRSIRKAQEKHLLKQGLNEEQAKRVARGQPADGPADDGDGGGDAGGGIDLAPSAAAPSANIPEQATAAQPKDGMIRASSGEDVPYVPRPADSKSRQTMLALLKKARELGSSDLHLSCGSKPFVRLHGDITFFKTMDVLDDDTAKKLISSVMTDADWSHFCDGNDWDGCVDLGPIGRYRTNVLLQRRGTSAVFRVIKDKVPELKTLGLPETLERFTTYHQGLVLVTGATGSGKSSTLAALIELINQNRPDHVITLEDPIEYIFESKSCNVTQRQIELHTRSWGNALRAALREDPDVIMIGEMRDLDTVRLAITAAETGHLVFGTLHTTNATRTIDRVLDVFPPKEQAQIRAMVSESLKGVVSQQLVKRADGKGRVAAVEIMFTTPAVSHLIRERRTFQLFSVMQTGKKVGMKLKMSSK